MYATISYYTMHSQKIVWIINVLGCAEILPSLKTLSHHLHASWPIGPHQKPVCPYEVSVTFSVPDKKGVSGQKPEKVAT